LLTAGKGSVNSDTERRRVWHRGAVQVLVVEDDDAIAVPLVTGLEREGYTVERLTDGTLAVERGARVDLVLLDLGLPGRDGRDVCRDLRAASNVPIIVITARGEEVDRVIGLELGADDYLVKPFGFRELVARIRAVTRRTGRTADLEEDLLLVAGSVRVDRRRHRVFVDDREVALTPKEFDLLALLAEAPGAVRTRTEIFEQVWDPHWYGPTKTLDVHMASLRKKLGAAVQIDTVRGVGFRLEP
jgi:two-component system, OmpR family, response regulator RegX3